MKTDAHGYPTEPVLTRMNAHPVSAMDGDARVSFGGPRAVVIPWPSEELDPGDRVRVTRHPSTKGTLTGYVNGSHLEVRYDSGVKGYWAPYMLEKIPQTETVTLELEPGDRAVPLSVVERVLADVPRYAGDEKLWQVEVRRRINETLDGEEADDE